jgi:hypothetical protein
MRYILFDAYDAENPVILNDNITHPLHAYRTAFHRIKETDNECYILFRPYAPEDVNPNFEINLEYEIENALADYIEDWEE